MGSWFEPPPLGSEDADRKARLLLTILRAMFGLGIAAFVIALFDSANHPVVTICFYLPLLSVVLGLTAIVRRGHVTTAAWGLSLFFWFIIAGVLPFFGGMRGHNGAVFAVSVMLVGIVIGGRQALALAILSVIWCAGVAGLEIAGALPPPVAPYSPVNAWIALTLTLILTTVMLRLTLDSLARLHARAAASAAERDEAARRSIQLQKMEVVGTLTSGIAHDFNNLLTVMRVTAEDLRRRVPVSDADGHQSLEALDAATLRASLMTRQLLSFGRAEGAVAPHDLAEVVRSLEPMLHRLLGSTIRVRSEAAQAAVVRASRAGLEQILLNLVVNARDAMPSGGELEIRVGVVRTSNGKDEATLAVRDTGAGMDAATRERIFEAFFTTKAAGTGLGLATVRTLVDRFGGSIDVVSAPGAGTTFTICFPLEPLAPGPTTPSPAKVASTRGRGRLLLVEDDPLVRRVTARLLESEGWDVASVQNGLEALALLERTHDFAVVVSDVSMPHLGGDVLAKKLAELYPTLPVVLVSGNRAPGPDVLGAPGRAFVEKPTSRETLLDGIERARAGATSR